MILAGIWEEEEKEEEEEEKEEETVGEDQVCGLPFELGFKDRLALSASCILNNTIFRKPCSSTSSKYKGMPAEMIQNPVPPILERFRALLKEREDELKVSEVDGEVLTLSSEDVVRIYEEVLSELSFNSKPIITELTIIAGEQREHAEGIADAICARIVEVPVEQKLPSLYLLDSIVKNIGCEYVKCFASRLPSVFCEAYKQIPPNQYPAMRHLFGTWSAVFPSSILRKIGAELQFSPLVNQSTSGSTTLRSSESQSRPIHGIHVNPKYLEARRLKQTAVNMSVTDSSTIAEPMTSLKGKRLETNASTSLRGWSGASSKFNDIPDPRGVSSSQQQYGQKQAFGFAEYDIDHPEIISQKNGIQRQDSPIVAARISLLGGAERDLSSKTQPFRSSSPSRVGPAESLSSLGDGLAMNHSPGRAVERASPSHSGLEFGAGRIHRRDGENSNWWTKNSLNNNNQDREASNALNRSNGFDPQRPRALIDAYGNYKVKSTHNEKPLKIEKLDVKSINNETAIKRWQNTEEEEYIWEDMSPTLVDRTRSNDLRPSNPPLRNFNSRIALGRPNPSLLEPDYGRGSWPRQAQWPIVNDSTISTEDGISIIGPSHESMSKKSVGGLGTHSEAAQIQASDYSHEPWNLKNPLPQSLQQLNPKMSGKAAKSSFLPAGTAAMVGQKIPSLVDNVEVPVTMGTAASIDKYVGRKPLPHMQPLVWPRINAQASHPSPPLSILPPQKQLRDQFDLPDTKKLLLNQVPSKPLLLPQQQLDMFESKPSISKNNLLQLPNQLEGLNNSLGHGQVSLLPPHLIKSQVGQENSIASLQAQVSSHLALKPSNFGCTLQGNNAIRCSLPLNQIPGLPSSVTAHGLPNTSFQLQGGIIPPLPPGPPPSASQLVSTSQDIGPVVAQPPVGNAFLGLISSLVAQGLISLTAPPVCGEDSVGVEFNPDSLKVRHESAITALYSDLPRQCTTCGLRFKVQEDHSSHMDWHVTKNRVSKNRKQKPSRKWFVSTSVWLSGAEALGTDVVPGFLPSEPVVEKKEDEEMAVPADENQNTCALCGEPFDDFYSDETEEWMYKGAVYLNVPSGSTETGMDRSQLGPIVHAKCRSESTVVPSEDFVLDEGGKIDEGNPRKRMRV